MCQIFCDKKSLFLLRFSFDMYYCSSTLLVMNNIIKKAKSISNLLQLAQEEAVLHEILPILMTPSEIENIYERVKILECLQNGLSQRKTLKKTEATAIATITRGAKVLKQVSPTLHSFFLKAQRLDWWRNLFWCA